MARPGDTGEVIDLVPLVSLGVDSVPAAVDRGVGHELPAGQSIIGDPLVPVVRNKLLHPSPSVTSSVL